MVERSMLTQLGLKPLPVGARRTAIGRAIYQDACTIFPWARSITGPGVRQTLDWIGSQVDGLQVTEIPTGTACFDWVVPKEWALDEAWLEDPDGNRIIDTKDTNLHVLNYSCPIDLRLSRSELDEHLYSLPDMPDAIPYATSYYQERWGFCLTQRQRDALPEGQYRAVIKTKLEPGSLSLGEIVVPGQTDEEILVSTYTCHPSMANNETSGIVVATMLARWLQSLENRRYTYRIVYCPETIGAIAFLSLRFEELKDRIKAGFVVTMVGDDRGYSCTETPSAVTIADRAARHVVSRIGPNPKVKSYMERASDERQYCAPGIDWPVVCLMRGGFYPEYHTSADDLSLISPVGLYGGFEFARLCIAALELNRVPQWVVRGEPHLSKYNVRGTLGARRELSKSEWQISHLLAFADGTRDLLDISELMNVPIWEAADVFDVLVSKGILRHEPESAKN